ncbi:phenylalanine--tRNA ligase subunit beta [Stratiformator vulcanicus]|uniref:Phenylalanine--tRNA ligase beta subunit n=1 Tax=Stratiformator vulcanicus TaxID=2527980 RepID=A0A517R6L1_9PLAN|nr:phenylalanine--tRNA ligase subunit beta [Stratiformator vulcanicus]QDT39495.1 Phenylalanine--tRNA ligase beta subunit [Stratiformator vulcanicus]
MIVSREWLSEYVDVDMPVEELTDRLTFSGLNLEGVEEVGDDVAIDLEVTSNRPDCLGHIGVAREIAVLYQIELKLPQAEPPASDEQTSDVTSVEIQCPDLCPRYNARIIRGIKVGPSPDWLVRRLESVGIKSVNNVVDATNYVMLETGQPFHAFDLAKLKEGRIVVRRAAKREKIEAIDHQTYELSEEMCVIADAERPVAVAGVMGGFDSEISKGTTDILLETAQFVPLTVRGTARKLKLFSPSQFRFERLVDATQLDWNSRRCAEVILDVAGGTLCAGSVHAGEEIPTSREPVEMRFGQIPRLLGIDIAPAEAVKILERLGLKVAGKVTDEKAAFVPPSWRPDLTRECDLIEEVARIYGYDEIPDDANIPVEVPTLPKADAVRQRMRAVLNGAGLSEAITITFISEDQQALFDPYAGQEPLRVDHSSRRHEHILRRSLVPSLLMCRRENERHGTANAELFEIAKTFLEASPGKPSAEPMVVSGVTGREFGDVKGIVESLVEDLCPDAVITARPAKLDAFAEGRAAELSLGDTPLGWVGELDTNVLESPTLDLRGAASAFELFVDPLVERATLQRTFEPIPQFPAVERDINFMLAEPVTWEKLSNVALAAGGELVESVEFASQFRGKQLGPNKKSYVMRLVFRSPEGTLTGDEVDKVQQQIVSACEQQCEAVQR